MTALDKLQEGDSHEHGNEASERLTMLRGGIAGVVREVTSDAEQAPKLSYRDRMKAHMNEVRAAYNVLSEADRATEGLKLFDELFEYFLTQEKQAEGPDVFTLKDFHNAIVRDFDHPEFHQALMAHFMGREIKEGVPDGEGYRSLSMKAREFDANGVRRRGFNIAEKGQKDEGMEMVSQARATFGEVLHFWEHIDDLQSQARVLYELAHIAEQTQDYRSAADVQTKSAIVATEGEDLVGALIATIKECEALFRGDLEQTDVLIGRLQFYAEMMRDFAAQGHTTASQWVGNAHAHLAEVQEAAGKIDEAIKSWGVVAADTEVQDATSLRQLKDRAPREISRLTKH